MPDKNAIHTQDWSFSFSEDDLSVELGIPRPEERGDDLPEQPPGDPSLVRKDWQLRPTVRMLRGPLREGVLKPVLHLFCKLHVLGRQNFDTVGLPCIIAANHTSHFDTPVIWEVVPKSIRKRMATAAAADHWFKSAAKSILPGLAYGAIPFPRKGSMGLKHCIELLQRGWSVLIFPEGTRSLTGHAAQFKLGTGRMAIATQRPIVPLALRGLEKVLPKDKSLPRRGDVWVAVGPPIVPQPGETAEQITRRLEVAVTALGEQLDPYSTGLREDAPGEETPGLY